MDRPVNLLSLGKSHNFSHHQHRLYSDMTSNVPTLDGGGIRGLSELLILREIMHRVRHDSDLPETPRPCEYFDLIGGTSTGGWAFSVVYVTANAW